MRLNQRYSNRASDGRLFQPALQAIGAIDERTRHDYSNAEEYNNLRNSITKAYEAQYYGTQVKSWKNFAQKPWVPFYANWKSGQDLGDNPFTSGGSPFAVDLISSPLTKISKLAKYSKSYPQLFKNIQANHAALDSSQYSKFLAKNFYLDSGYSLKSAADHLRGIDFSKSVKISTVTKGAERIQYRLPGSPQGNYYALLDSDKSKLGIYTSGRQPYIYKAKVDVQVLRSYTRPMVDDYSMKVYGWKILTNGGEVQEFTPLKDFFTYVK